MHTASRRDWIILVRVLKNKYCDHFSSFSPSKNRTPFCFSLEFVLQLVEAVYNAYNSAEFSHGMLLSLSALELSLLSSRKILTRTAERFCQRKMVRMGESAGTISAPSKFLSPETSYDEEKNRDIQWRLLQCLLGPHRNCLDHEGPCYPSEESPHRQWAV